MGQRDYFDKKPTLGQNNNALVFLFTVNTIIFLILIFLELVVDLEYRQEAQVVFNDNFLFWFSLSPDLKTLLVKPWSIIVYSFANGTIIEFIANMLWLWAFGYILQDLVGNKKLVPVYLYGGFFGGLFFILGHLIFSSSPNTLFLESNTAVLAVAIATTTLSPNYKIFQQIGNGISLWVLTAVFLLIDVAYLYGNTWPIIISHISAALIGFIYIKQLKSGNDWGAWIYKLLSNIEKVFSPSQKNKSSQQKQKISNDNQEKLDAILDKINQKGYDSLTKADKDFLEEYSN